MRRWMGTSAQMEQPPLDHHYLVMHLGGAKRVRRRCDGPPVTADVDSGSITLVPAGTAYRWHTEGPIAFSHLYLGPGQLESFVAQGFDVGATGARLVDTVGCRDSELERLMRRMLEVIDLGAAAPSLVLDALLEAVCARLAHAHIARASSCRGGVAALAPHRLRRVLDFIESRYADDIGLADLAAAAGSSQSHFARAFRIATGRSPYRCVLERRIDHAKVLLLTGAMPLHDVSTACGFRRQQQFSTVFRQHVGIGPKQFTMRHR